MTRAKAPVPMPRSALTIKYVPEVAVPEPRTLVPNVPLPGYIKLVFTSYGPDKCILS